MTQAIASLEAALQAGPYQAYTYAYPHKTAYRMFNKPIALETAWKTEDRSSLFLYIHLPFCEMRCGFCNLFTLVNAEQSLEVAYLNALERQALRVRDSLEQAGGATFSRIGFGGGTPTILAPNDLHKLFNIGQLLAPNLERLPISIETSPATATTDRLEVLQSRGVDRVSIGVQSFLESEVHAVGRAQKISEVHAALERLRSAQFSTLNIDLIYGLPGQTRETWLESLRAALEFEPEELFLYPLYVRPLTGLGKLEHQKAQIDPRLDFYRTARGFLLERGYSQSSMRIFQRNTAPERRKPDLNSAGLEFDAQDDGLIGLGCGARSYTHDLHYSSEYAVGQSGVREIIADFVQRPNDSFDFAMHGARLNRDEQQRRYILQALLRAEGIKLGAYANRFNSRLLEDWPQLQELISLELAELDANSLRLNSHGLELSDAIGPWLYSPTMQDLSAGYGWR
jgi:oxygen-independent coproporphyrinogen III oxidase